MGGRTLVAVLAVLAVIDAASGQPARRGTQVEQLQQLEARLRGRFQQERAAAAQWAQANGVPLRQVHPDGTVTELVFMRDGRPFTYTTLNAVSADTVSTDELWGGGSSGLALTGSGVPVHEWDGGEVRLTHVELAGAVTWADDTNPGLSDHATHVAGTIVGAGVNAAARGMAFQASLSSYDFSDDNAEMAAAAAGGARVSNHSYSYIRGWYWNPSTGDWYWYGTPAVSQTEDAQFGYYDAASQAWDNIAFNAPFYLICCSAGNDRNDSYVGGHWVWSGGWIWSTQNRGADGGATGYDSIGQLACAKNVLTVGAVNDIPGGHTAPGDVVMSSFSGWGPTDDGRVKPDIVANGVSLYSSSSAGDASYTFKSGTSMSSPSAVGSLALLIQHYRSTHAGADMRSSTLKGLVIHTADEAGTAAGPDYSFGWGLLNALAAAQHISLDQTNPEAIQELSINQGQTIQQVWGSDGGSPLRATICWTDPPGTPAPFSLDPPNLMLVNDLDLRVIGPDATVHRPWRLNPASPAAAATNGDNTRDNVEVIVIDTPMPGNYTVQVTHKGTLSGGSQDFGLILSVGPASACPPGEVEDCNGNCAPAEWIGDGFCDNGAYSYGGNLIDFNCAAFGFDGGDCAVAPTASIMWRNYNNGANIMWLMDGATKLGTSGGMPVKGLNWSAAGVGDFNGDGEAYDVLWRHATGANALWLMHGRSVLDASGALNTVHSSWLVAGVGDFDGDGRTDIMWRRPANGKNVMWLMDGTTKLPGSGALPTVNSAWAVAGVGDFNGDGNADILWRNQAAGKLVLWLMNGTAKLPGSGPVLALNSAWYVVGVGDLDGDARADIVWRHPGNGKNVVWLMNGTTKLPGSGLTISRHPSWTLDGTSDFDADGRCDLLWRQDATGRNALWFMNGAAVLPGSGDILQVPNPALGIAGTSP